MTNPSRTAPSSPRTLTHRSPASASIRDARFNDNTPSSMSDFLKNTAPSNSSGYTMSHASGASNSRLQRMVISDAPPTIPTTLVEVSKEATPSSGVVGLPAIIRQTWKEDAITSYYPKNRLLAREASGTTRSDTTSALADFFRNTDPPVKGEMPVHRISRSVAPFRNTMDSAQFDATVDPNIIEDTEPETTSTKAHSIVSAPQESYSSSFTSSTALLRHSSKKTLDYGGTSVTASSMPDVKRKQIRVKDPYAIAIDGLDDDDIEDMQGLTLVLPKKREEESLVDFLRNTPPPPPTAPQSFVQTNFKTVQKKSSSVSLMSRFSRSSRKNSIASNADKIPLGTPTGAFQPRHVPLRVPAIDGLGTRRTSSGSDQHPQPSHVPLHVDFDNHHAVNNAATSRNPPRANIQARQARTARNDTDSLADFLKHTGPPAEARDLPPQKEESRTLLQKISFSRNKKVGVA
jgi:hypothetical protein